MEKVYHPFIAGPYNKLVSELMQETGTRINIPPPSVNKTEIVFTGEKEQLAQAVARVKKIYEEKVWMVPRASHLPPPAHSPSSLLVLLLCIPQLHTPHVSSCSAALAVHGPGSYRFLAQQSGTWGDSFGEVISPAFLCVEISRPQRTLWVRVFTGAAKEGGKCEGYSVAN